ncbi:CHAD domain-containing protein [Uliginosibacterium gangwonense]|uniref:CYTH and CHAD domain-containing protein n=1 Tax=Uliginosibacterium gangwonense TaxID=392736 RepID=UPI00035D756E|nr:CHAD domain-containing protein [Uliginosibacterium gangwonense]
MAQETELKLVFPPSAQSQVLAHPLIARSKRLGQIQMLVNTYYDTPDLALGQKKVALRTRKAGKQMLQTVKCAAESVGGLSSRPEWEQNFSGEFDFSAVADEPRRLLEQHREAIVPLFSTDFHRETFVLEPAEGVRILAMVDRGTIKAAGREEDICELELEIEHGEPCHLWALAIELAQDLPVVPFDPSKAARGYQLFRDEPVRPVRAQPSCIHAQQSPVQAFKALGFQILQAWQANTWGALNLDAPDYVHQMRVSLRRLRTLVRVFAKALPAQFVSEWTEVLTRLANGMGVARDMDVLLASVVAPVVADSPDDDALLALQVCCDQARQGAKRVAREQMRQSNCGAPLLKFAQELNGLADVGAGQSLVIFAHACLRRLRKRLRVRLAQAVADPGPVALHKLRIGFKRMRYALEFFAPLMVQKTVVEYLKQLSSLQDDLGHLNDLEVAQVYFHAWGDKQPALREAGGFVRGWHAPQAAALRQAVLERSARLLEARAPWRKLDKSIHKGSQSVAAPHHGDS